MEITKYEDTRFLARLKKYGVIRLFQSSDFWVSVMFTLILALLFGFDLIKYTVIPSLATVYLSIALAFFGIIIAGQSIVVSSLQKDFVKIMRSAQAFDNIMFKFYYIALFILLSIIVTISLIIMLHIYCFKHTLIIVIFILNSFLFLYGVISSFLLVGTIMRYAIYRADSMLSDDAERKTNSNPQG